jgi:tRNA-2-methylthio-N6-dimethylallyladenosine synthase
MGQAVYLQTYGCQMNEYDSELIRSILIDRGYHFASTTDEADVVLLNTCAIRENAHRKIYGQLDLFLPIKKQRAKARQPFIVGILGCMAQNLKDELLEHRAVDLVVGPDSYRALPDLIGNITKTRKPAVAAFLSEYETYSDIAPVRQEGVNAWIAIMRGCDNFCTFCVVPYTRGRERSRSMESILHEVRQLVSMGYPQVTLLGQNVNSYRCGEDDFADLMVAVAKVPGVQRIRFTSPHPKDFPIKLLHVMAEYPNICKHIHLPLQAGSNRILGLMSRTYTAEEYLELVDTIRNILPMTTLTTDIIIGFPTETEDDFQETVNLVRQVEFDSAYIFKYSERKGTIAAREYPDDVTPEIKTDRIVRLIEIQRQISLNKHQPYIGRKVQVMVEGKADKDPGHWIGKDDGNITTIFPSPFQSPGETVFIEVRQASSSTLYGVITAHSDLVAPTGVPIAGVVTPL